LSNQIIVADTSPLIAFARIDHMVLLSKLFGTVIIPQTVLDECIADLSRPGAQDIRKFIDQNLIKIHPDVDFQKHATLFDILDNGEISAIALALQLDSRLLIDEKLGRSAAKELGLKIIGTAGILLLAKQKNLIHAVSPLIEELKSAGYYLSDALSKEILRLAKE
jgi:predicted nucleic acid-binding protein